MIYSRIPKNNNLVDKEINADYFVIMSYNFDRDFDIDIDIDSIDIDIDDKVACKLNVPRKAKTNPKKIGRRKIEMTDEMYKQVCALCAIQCTAEEIASVLDISVDTLERRIYEREGLRFAEFFKIKRKAGFASLRRMQWEKAKTNDSTMLIWLGKQYLGQKDVPDAPQDHNKPEIYMRPARLAESDED